MHNDNTGKGREKGSILLLALIVGSALSLFVGSFLHLGVVETVLNERNITFIQAKNAVESLAQSATAQLVKRWQSQHSFSLNELQADNKPLVITQEIKELLKNSPIDIDRMELVGGIVPSGAWFYVAPDDPSNQFDSEKGIFVYARNVKIMAKVVATTIDGNEISVQAIETLQVRDTPLFAYAIFYNMDMDLFPLPPMTVSGPVHTNGDFWVTTNTHLYFNSIVTASGQFRHGLIHAPTKSKQGFVWFKNADGTYLSNYKGRGSKGMAKNYYDSLDSNWKNYALNRWDGNVKSVEHGVVKKQVLGVEDYVADDPNTTALNDDLNYAYALIEPNLSTSDPDYKGETEKEKFAYKAGLIVRVHDKNDGVPPLHAHDLSANYAISLNKLKRVDPNNPSSEPELDINNNVQEVAIVVDADFISSTFQMREYEEDGDGNPLSGLWNDRQDKGVSLLELSIVELRKGIDDTDPDFDDSVWVSNYTPNVDYNGSLYVEFPRNTSISGRPDKVVVARDQLAVRLNDAKVLPTPSYNNDYNRTQGFTLSTNATLYTLGHFNADGNPTTGSSVMPDDQNTPNPPASLAADAITILSSTWDDTLSKNNKFYRKAVFNEVTAGLISGIVPANKDGSYSTSGGVDVFSRLLEDWRGKSFRYRGSMVCLYESEIDTQPVQFFYYSPPIRDWGFYDQFARGNFPPAMPMSRSFKILKFGFVKTDRYLNQVEEISQYSYQNNPELLE